MLEKVRLESLGLKEPLPEPHYSKPQSRSLTAPEQQVLKALLLKHKPMTIVEIGVWWGATTRLMGETLPTAKIYAVDIQRRAEAVLPVNAQFIQANSMLWCPRALIGKVDFIVVDGCHNYHAVLADTRLALLLAHRGSVIVWHDVESGPRKEQLVDDTHYRIFRPTADVWGEREVNLVLAHYPITVKVPVVGTPESAGDMKLGVCVVE